MALNTISINDRLGDGGLESVAVFSHDSTGNVTGLVGADGAVHATLGTTILTVGAGGRFATLQEAIDYVETQGAFILLSSEYIINSSGAVTTWAQNSSTFSPSTSVFFATDNFVTPIPVEKIWFKVEGDAYYYPLEEGSSGALGAGLQEIATGMRRIEASVATVKAITWYRQNDYVIYLLDDTNEDITIGSDVCVTIIGNGRNVYKGVISKGAGFVSGKLAFRNIILSEKNVGGGMFAWTAANTIALEFLDGVSVDSVQDDFIYPTCYLGSLRAEHCTVTQQPTAVQGHCFSPGEVRGDIVVQNIVWRPINQASIGTTQTNNVYLVDLGGVGANSARKVIINGVSGYLRDKFSDFADVAIFGSAVRIHTADIFISNCHLIAPDSIGANLSIAKLGVASTGANLYLTGNTIEAKATTGTIKLVAAGANPAGACTVRVGRGNNVVKCDAQANITYSKADAQASGTATVASGNTSIAVTHGLGYTPDTADIQITPTLLSNAAKWWVTAVGATTFTINVDADPGAGTATFAWRIAD